MLTYIPGDICPQNIRTMSAKHLPRETYILREMLSTLYPFSGFISGVTNPRREGLGIRGMDGMRETLSYRAANVSKNIDFIGPKV